MCVCVCVRTPWVALYPRNKNLLCYCLLQWMCEWELSISRGAFAFDYIPHIVKGGSCWDTVAPGEMEPGSTWWGTADSTSSSKGPQKSLFHLPFNEALGQRGVFPKVNELCFLLSRTIRLSHTTSVYDTGYQDRVNLHFTVTPDKVTAPHWVQSISVLLPIQYLSFGFVCFFTHSAGFILTSWLRSYQQLTWCYFIREY